MEPFSGVVKITQEPCPGWSSTGFAYRAYWSTSGLPLFIGAETREGCRQSVLEFHPTVTFEESESEG